MYVWMYARLGWRSHTNIYHALASIQMYALLADCLLNSSFPVKFFSNFKNSNWDQLNEHARYEFWLPVRQTDNLCDWLVRGLVYKYVHHKYSHLLGLVHFQICQKFTVCITASSTRQELLPLPLAFITKWRCIKLNQIDNQDMNDYSVLKVYWHRDNTVRHKKIIIRKI